LPPGSPKRHLGFAFANADVLLEVGADGFIRYAEGETLSLLGVEAGVLVGSSLFSLFAEPDRRLLRRLLSIAPPGRRLGPLRLAGAPRPITSPAPLLFAGYRSEAAEQTFLLTLSRPRLAVSGGPTEGQRDPPTGLLTYEGFSGWLAERIESAARDGAPACVTLLELRGLEKLLAQVRPSQAEGLLADIGTSLRVCSADGQTAGRLDGERFALLQHPGSRLEELQTEIDRQVARVAPADSGLEVRGQVLDIEPGTFDPQTTVRLVSYVVGRFLEGNGAMPGANLAERLEMMLNETVHRVVSLKGRIEGRRLSLALQPIVAARDRELRHYEALSRFEGHDTPAQTISLAERTGLILDLDLLVFHQVSELLRSIARFGDVPPIAVNISASSLGSDAFVESLRHLLQRYGSLRRKIAIEVTESARLADLPRADRVIQQIRRDGHLVGLDDFGTGEASFPYIQALAVDFVKLDGLYVQRLLTDRRSEAILRAMIALCRDLGVGTIAEMVETEAQLARLRELGVDCVQGYLVGHPLVDLDPADLALPRGSGPLPAAATG